MRKLTPQEIIQNVPDVQTVRLPNHWFDDLNENKSVFDSLYAWMFEKGGVAAVNNNHIENRTYVGEKLYKKLLSTEKKFLGKKFKIKGDELDREVSWSDRNAGPMTEIGDFKISGDVIMVIPESSKLALAEFSIKIFRKERLVSINRIKANAAGSNFFQWLLSQIDRDDFVGDAAREVALAEEFPRENNPYSEIKSDFDFQGICTSWDEGIKQGWVEYLLQYPDRVQPFAWCSECGKRMDIADALLSWSLESLELFVLDVVCLEKFKKFDQMVSRPLSGIGSAELELLVETEGISELDIENLEEMLKLWGIMPIVSVEGSVYFIRSEKTHEIKIGFTAGRIEDRLRALQTSHPHKLQVLAISLGNRAHEKALHEKFASIRLRGEWFEPHPDLLTYISVLPSY